MLMEASKKAKTLPTQDGAAAEEEPKGHFASHQCRHALIKFLPRNTATLVSKSWLKATNHQMTRLKYRSTITDAAVQALASSCPNLTTVDLYNCTNITDAAVQALGSVIMST